MTRTDRRVRRTRERLQRALLELIGERGYDAITIQDIVDREDLAEAFHRLQRVVICEALGIKDDG